MESKSSLLRTWRTAAEDLGIEVEPHGDDVVVRQFGSHLGMLCSVSNDWAAVKSDADQLGMGFSVLGPSYLSYDRALVIETLNDWGWCGTDDPPRWYTGQPWTSS